MTALPQAPATPRGRTAHAWRLSVSGVRLVAALELRQRVRSTKWVWVLVAFGALVGAVTLLTAANITHEGEGDTVFGIIVFFVLFLGLLVSPTLAATSINGDNKEGTLAPLQATALSAADIVFGKLLGAWVASLAFVAVSIPFVAYAMAISESHVGALFTTIAVLAVELLFVCAFGLGWSALTSRPSASAVLSYFTVATLAVLSLVFFGLTVLLVTTKEPVEIYGSGYVWESEVLTLEGSEQAAREIVEPVWDEDTEWVEPECKVYTVEREQFHSERTWWMLAANPFVIVADAAPIAKHEGYYSYSVLGSIKESVRQARLGPADTSFECWTFEHGQDVYYDQFGNPADPNRQAELDSLGPVWPFGLGSHLLLAAAALWFAVRRVSVPHGKLATGTRVA